jgi:hypothetical protein
MVTPAAIEAIVDLADPAHGGLDAPIPTPTRSLLLKFDGESIGAQISTTDGLPLAPGVGPQSVPVTFWAEEAEYLAVPSRQFDVSYGRTVGRVRIIG